MTAMNISCLVAVLACLFLLSSCDSAREEELPSLFPSVQVGDTWIMTRTDSLGNGYPAPPVSVDVTTDTVAVVENREIDGQTWFRIGNGTGDGFAAPLLNVRDFFAFREDGIWQLTSGSNPLRIITFPTESTREYAVQEGVFYRFVETDIVYDSPTFGEIPVTRYQHRYTTDFRPLAGDVVWGDFALDAEKVTETLYSAELGIVRVENFYVSPISESGTMHIVGSITWELEMYLPASGQ